MRPLQTPLAPTRRGGGRLIGGVDGALIPFTAAFIALHAAGCGGGPTAARPLESTISGTVRDAASATPVAGALVTTVPATAPKSTDQDGNYTISNPPSGAYSIVAAKEGYEGDQRSIVVRDGESVRADLQLRKIIPPATAAAVNIIPSLLTLEIGQSSQLSATVRDSAGNELVGRPISWASNNASIAAVSPSSGTTVMATGVGVGSAVITASSGVVEKQAIVTTILPAPVFSIAITPSSGAVAIGSTLQLNAVVADESGRILTGRPIIWTSSSPAAAPISATGLLSGLAVAPAVTITATAGGKSATAQFAVTAAVVSTVQVAPGSPTVVAGSTVQMTATPRDASGNVLTGRTITWSTADPLVATVTAAGLVTGVLGGTTQVTAASDGITGSATVSVTNPVPTIAGLSPDSATAGAPGLSLTVSGSGFVAASVVRWNGQPRATTVQSSTDLQATLIASDLATPGPIPVTVNNPPPGGGTSTPRSFTVKPSGLVGYGEIIAKTLSAGATDKYLIGGIAGQEINLFFQVLDNTCLAIRLLSPSGNQLASISRYGPDESITASSTGRLTLASNGNFAVEVSGCSSGNAGRYRFQVILINRSPELIPAAIELDKVVEGETIDPAGDIDEFTLAIASAVEVNVFFQVLDDTCLRLDFRDPDDSQIGTSGSSFGPAATLYEDMTGRLSLGRTGTYIARVYGCSSSHAGRYKLQVFKINRAPETLVSAIAVGNIIGGEDIRPPGDIDEFTFSNSTSRELNIFFQVIDNATLRLQLLDPDGSVLRDIPGFGPNSTLFDNLTDRVTISRTGTYRIRTFGSGDFSQGGYRFQVFQIDRKPEVAPSAITIGAIVDGEDISPPGDIDEFTLSITAPRTASVLLQAVDNACFEIDLLDPSGNLVKNGDGCGPMTALGATGINQIGLTLSGTYTVRVYGSSSVSRGRYRFQVTSP